MGENPKDYMEDTKDGMIVGHWDHKMWDIGNASFCPNTRGRRRLKMLT